MPADMEIGIYRWEADTYAIDLRVQEPGGAEDGPRLQSTPVRIPFAALTAAAAAPEAYGRLLWQALFADPALAQAFAAARAAVANQLEAAGGPMALRVRLYVSPNAPELHGLRWETLFNPDPAPGAWLATDERAVFSRYAATAAWRPLRPPPVDRNHLSVVVAVANPAGLDKYAPGGAPFAPIDVAPEVARAKAALGPAVTTELTGAAGAAGRASLEAIVAAVRAGCDVLYVVAHGAVIDHEPHLWLETDTGGIDVVTGARLLGRVRALPELPRLIVLASCQSGGRGDADGDAPAALGPKLVAAGVPAVLAMQGDVTMAGAAAFLSAFFAGLKRHGGVDRAAAEARAAAVDQKRADWWAPVLFHRLRDGQLWDARGPQGGPPPPFPQFTALVAKLRQGRCTAVLGSGVIEHLLGSSRTAAARLAERHRVPLRPADRDDLPQVAQYLRVSRGNEDDPRAEVDAYFAGVLRAADRAAPAAARLDDLILRAGRAAQAADRAEPHAVLARLPFPVYVTTNADSLLADSLVRAGRPPHVDLFAKLAVDRPAAVAAIYGQVPGAVPPAGPDRPANAPTPAAPLVYHLYGHWLTPESLVLTETDYFDYLLTFTSQGAPLPSAVQAALTQNTLVFLGFRLDEWDFRVLVRSINALEGSANLRGKLQVAVQIDPADSPFPDVAAARAFLEKGTELGSQRVSVYWGATADFLTQLDAHYQAAVGGVLP